MSAFVELINEQANFIIEEQALFLNSVDLTNSVRPITVVILEATLFLKALVLLHPSDPFS